MASDGQLNFDINVESKNKMIKKCQAADCKVGNPGSSFNDKSNSCVKL